MEWINLSELKVGHTLISLGLVLEMSEAKDGFWVKVDLDGGMWLPFLKKQMLLIQK